MTKRATGRTDRRGQILIAYLLPLLIYLLAAVLISWPAAAQLGTFGLGAGYGDQFENARLVWWTQYALQHGLSPFYQSLLGYPDGFFSAAQWAQPLGYLPAVAISFVTGPVAALSLWTIIELALNGLAAFILCRMVLGNIPPYPQPLPAGGGNPSSPDQRSDGEEKNPSPPDPLSHAVSEGEPNTVFLPSPIPEQRVGREGSAHYLAALIGGLVFMIFPAMQGHLSAGHVNVLALYGFPLYALCLWRITLGIADWRTVFWGSLLIVVTATGDTDQVVYTLLPLTLFWLGYCAIWQRSTFWSRLILSRLLAMFAAGLLLLLPFFIPLALQLSAPTKAADLQLGGWVSYSTDPLSFVTFSPFTPWGASLAPGFARTVLGTNSIEGTGYLGLVVSVLAAIAIVAYARRGWLRQLWPWLTIAFGSAVFSLGPFLKWANQPITYSLGNYKSYITLPWAFFQALPVLNASRTPGRFNLTTGLAVAIIAAAGAHLLLSRTRRLTVLVGVTAVLLVGIGVDYQLFSPALTTPADVPAYMTDLARRSDVRAVFDIPWDDNLAAKDALYWQTAHHKPMIAGQALRTTPVDPAKLNVLQSMAMGGGLTPKALALLDNAGVDVVIVHLAAVAPATTLETIGQRLGTPIFRDDRIAIYNVPKTSYQLAGRDLISANSTHWETLSVYSPVAGYLRFNAKPDTTSSLVTIDAQTTGLYGSDLYLAAGYHTILRPLEIRYDESITFKPAPPRLPIHMSHQLALIASLLKQTPDQITLSATWQADQTLNHDYHYFIHLVDPRGGRPIAQADGQPGGGAFPTNQWRAGQTWTETTTLSLAGLAPGRYQVQIGWYSYPDMKQLVTDIYDSVPVPWIEVGQVLIPTPGDYF